MDVTVGIEDTDRIGIVGINGTGKSTFLKIIAGTARSMGIEVVDEAKK